MACPLNIDGETAAILVSWSETLGKGESLQSVFNSYPFDIQTVDERVYRAAHLIVNDPDLVAGTAQDPSTAATFLRKLDECAQSLNYGGVKDGMPFPINELRSNRSFRDELAIKLIQVLADPSCGLPRRDCGFGMGEDLMPNSQSGILGLTQDTPQPTNHKLMHTQVSKLRKTIHMCSIR